ncbi:acyltransferase family protein [Arcticibacter tournemirensis]
MTTLKPRLLSLDVFRGATVAAMILVNNPGSWGHIYPPLEHAEWNGCTPTDLIFPFFLYIVGVAIAFAFGSKKEDQAQHSKLILRAFKRGLILFFLGFFLALFPAFDFSTVRIFGVLQRIGIVFFICAVLFIKTSTKTQFRTLLFVLILYWVLMTLVPVPGVGYPNLDKETNLAAWLDRLIITEQHTWKAARTWDPEGILSTLPAIGTGILGMLAGTWLRRKDKTESEKIAWMFSLGFISALLGQIWGLAFPINKSLWTSSYVLYAGGLATMMLALLYWMIDVQGYKKYTKPFVAYGVNAITVFFMSAIIVKVMSRIKIDLNGEPVGLQTWLYKSFFTPYLSDLNASLAWAVTFVLFWLLILWPMYKKNIIIKV